jgi:hypothetical protein
MQPDPWPLIYQADYPEGDHKPRSNEEVNNRYRTEPTPYLGNQPEVREILHKLNISPHAVYSVDVTEDFQDKVMIITCHGGLQYTLKRYWSNECDPEWRVTSTQRSYTGYDPRFY